MKDINDKHSLRILIPIEERIGGPMSAVGIRKYEIGRALSSHFKVTFASPFLDNAPIDFASHIQLQSPKELSKRLDDFDVLYSLGLTVHDFRAVVHSKIRMVLDLYTPLAFEILESFPELPIEALEIAHQRITKWTTAQLRICDYVVCASEPQRNFWLGTLNASGILNPTLSRQTPNCRDFLDVIPFGLPPPPPQTTAINKLQEHIPSLTPDDFVLLWSSKILAWQDPVTLIEAVNIATKRDSAIKLVFLGIGSPQSTAHKNYFDSAQLRTQQAIDCAQKLGLINKSVHFIHDRVPYHQMIDYYRSAHAGVATYPDSLETDFCLGSRLLDFVWAGLPVIISGGSLQREFVREFQLGKFASAGDSQKLADCILELRNQKWNTTSPNADYQRAQFQLQWTELARPLIKYLYTIPPSSFRPHRDLFRAYRDLGAFVYSSFMYRLKLKRMGINR